MLPIKKLYIDSKARSADSKSTTNFAVDLKESLPMPDDATFIVADVMIPHTWYLMSPDQNRTLYIKEDLGGGQSGQYLYESHCRTDPTTDLPLRQQFPMH